jgi:hypothetical protein
MPQIVQSIRPTLSSSIHNSRSNDGSLLKASKRRLCDMPIDIVRLVQDNLNLEDNANLAYTCKTFYDIFAKTRKQYQELFRKYAAVRISCCRDQARAAVDGPCWSSRDLLALIWEHPDIASCVRCIEICVRTDFECLNGNPCRLSVWRSTPPALASARIVKPWEQLQALLPNLVILNNMHHVSDNWAQSGKDSPQELQLQPHQDRPWVQKARHVKIVGSALMKQHYSAVINERGTNTLLLTAPAFQGWNGLSSRQIMREVILYNLLRYVRVIELGDCTRKMSIGTAVDIRELDIIFTRSQRLLVLKINLTVEELKTAASSKMKFPNGNYCTRLEDAADASSGCALCVYHRHSRVESALKRYTALAGSKGAKYAVCELLRADASDKEYWEAFFDYVDAHKDGLFTW